MNTEEFQGTDSVPAQRSTEFKYLNFISTFMVGSLLISNVIATVKFIEYGPIVLSKSFYIYPAVMLGSDIMTEVYGMKYTKRTIYAGFVLSMLMVLALQAARFGPSPAN